MAEANLDTVELTGNKPAPQAQPTEPSTPAPTPESAAPEPAAETEAPEGGEGAEQQPEASEQKPAPRVHNAFQTRIDKLTKEKHDALRKQAELEIELEQFRTSQKPAAPAAEGAPAAAAAPAQPQNLDQLVQQRAQQLYQQNVQRERTNAVLSAGNGEYKDFTDRCNVVANLGGADRPDFMEIVTDPSIVPDGHKIIAALADNPDEAARILSLPTVAMSAELARYAERVAKPAPKAAAAISKAPAPIKPLSGSAPVNDEPSETDSEDDWFRKREAQRAQRSQVARSL